MTQTDPIDTPVTHDEDQGEQPAARLVAFAEAIEAAKGDLSGTLERLAQSLYERDRRELLDEMLTRERENPGAFLSGALAGYVIGRGGIDFRTLQDDATPSAEEGESAQQDVGEPYPPEPDDEKP